MTLESVLLAYGLNGLALEFPSEQTTVIAPTYRPPASHVLATLRTALSRPVAGPPLRAVVRPGHQIAVSMCDITRPQPRELIVRALLDELEGIARPEVANLIALPASSLSSVTHGAAVRAEGRTVASIL